jgi:hypothetical protein
MIKFGKQKSLKTASTPPRQTSAKVSAHCMYTLSSFLLVGHWSGMTVLLLSRGLTLSTLNVVVVENEQEFFQSAVLLFE